MFGAAKWCSCRPLIFVTVGRVYFSEKLDFGAMVVCFWGNILCLGGFLLCGVHTGTI